MVNVHVDFPLLQRLALPITVGAVRYPGIKLHDPRVIRLLEVLLHGGSHVGGWSAKPATPTEPLPKKRRPGIARLLFVSSSTTKALRSARNSRFHHRPVARHQPHSKLETAYHRADKAKVLHTGERTYWLLREAPGTALIYGALALVCWIAWTVMRNRSRSL